MLFSLCILLRLAGRFIETEGGRFGEFKVLCDETLVCWLFLEPRRSIKQVYYSHSKDGEGINPSPPFFEFFKERALHLPSEIFNSLVVRAVSLAAFKDLHSKASRNCRAFSGCRSQS